VLAVSHDDSYLFLIDSVLCLAEKTTSGVIKKILNEDQVVGSSPHTIHARPDSPRYLIENDVTHKETAYRVENILALVEKGEEAGAKTIPSATELFTEDEFVVPDEQVERELAESGESVEE
jgi:hypothetical protein